MTQQVVISVDNVSKIFRLPHERHGSIKSLFVNMFRRKRTYEKQKALKNISFDVKQGEFFGIVGRNGSGKSTLMKLLAGIYVPSKGVIRINGKLTPFIELGVGFNPELTGRENVFLNGALLGFNRKEMEAMYDDIVSFAEIEKFMDQKLKNYSSGMQVRLAFSIAIRAKSDIFLIDEVLAVGDLAFQEKCYKVFEEIKASGKTIVFISHDGSAIERFCDRVAIIDKSELIAIGKPRDMVLKYGAIVAEDQQEAGNKEVKNKVTHHGNGSVSISKVTLRNFKGETKSSIVEGEPFTIFAEYSLKSSLKDKVIVGLDIIDEHGISILGPNTNELKKIITLLSDGNIEARFNSNPLASGKYSVTFGVFNHNASFAYDLTENAMRFKVLGERRHGKIYIEPEWTITQNT
ncbi:ABC transporter ATP-binding protein [bacterium]|nr:ABC transporter ATP-binding protein [bacterium]NBX97999.1 ABC transporter ATP-binding protein [bacterium]NDC96042.1 ABC transporter ATP-binding protein [bacterium]NDD85009.1 ABC transporter ATP-binding protein [bacterium]NDG31759.1 ABC transporter ATP-binding protein [bacterium]